MMNRWYRTSGVLPFGEYGIEAAASLEELSFCQCSHLQDDDSAYCKCGEIEHCPAWGWSTTEKTHTTFVSKDRQKVVFHEVYSVGVACVRGDTPFVNGNHYFWELKVGPPVYGTSMMIGVGTCNVNVNKYLNEFDHILGNDEESWGLDMIGGLFHNGRRHKYNEKAGFFIGSIIGVHLDMWHGTLEFFLNRESLGIAFRGLKNKVLYPMISSTAAKSSMLLNYSVICPHSLLFLALRTCDNVDPDTLPFGLKKALSTCWWRFPKPVKQDLRIKTGPGRRTVPRIYILIDSDDEDPSEANGVLAMRMKRVLENSASGICDASCKIPKLALTPRRSARSKNKK